MQTEKLLEILTTAVEELKAHDVKVLDVRANSSVTDIMLIASGSSTRQVSALARHIIDTAKQYDINVLGDEGIAYGEWALVDLGDVVVHIMLPSVRDFYQLEKLWTDK
jgi:ribosome-associated protein